MPCFAGNQEVPDASLSLSAGNVQPSETFKIISHNSQQDFIFDS
jgi:hypothetical protein